MRWPNPSHIVTLHHIDQLLIKHRHVLVPSVSADLDRIRQRRSNSPDVHLASHDIRDEPGAELLEESDLALNATYSLTYPTTNAVQFRYKLLLRRQRWNPHGYRPNITDSQMTHRTAVGRQIDESTSGFIVYGLQQELRKDFCRIRPVEHHALPKTNVKILWHERSFSCWCLACE